MPDSKRQAHGSGADDIQWHRLNDIVRKNGKTSGLKIECSMPDEIDLARKLALKIRKKSMLKLIQNENQIYQQELNRIGYLYTTDIVCEDMRLCNREQANKGSKYNNVNQMSSLSKLFKMLED